MVLPRREHVDLNLVLYIEHLFDLDALSRKPVRTVSKQVPNVSHQIGVNVLLPRREHVDFNLV